MNNLRQIFRAMIRRGSRPTLESEIIDCWLEPKDWRHRHQWDVARSGPAIPTLRMTGTAAVLGRTITTAHCTLGSYGMGGPGFLGLSLAATTERPPEWLVLRLWGAAQWCLFDGRPVQAPKASYFTPYGTKQFVAAVSDRTILGIDVRDRMCLLRIGIADGEVHRLEIPEDTSRLPALKNGRRRSLAPTDSLWDAWVLSPSEHVCV